ncbi:hypothetical protein IMZ48_13635 [Candidatus Bathyarchaeota archaeon]|nr:hypothetical protein [Candidatus Bathyarchaeota archaeon]
MLNGWIYVINSPPLIAAAMRHRNLSFDPFALEFSANVLGMTAEQHAAFFTQMDNYHEVNRLIHRSLAGEDVLRMAVSALASIAGTVNGIGPGAGLVAPDAYGWLSVEMFMASTNALFGRNNPFAPEDAFSFL